MSNEAASTTTDGTSQAAENTQTQQPGGEQNQQQQQAPDFNTWLAAQPEDVRSLVEGNTRGLRSALEGERTQRKSLKKELDAAIKQLEEGNPAKAGLERVQTQLKQMEQQNSFYDEAHRQGATNLGLAYMAAQQLGMFEKNGEVDFKVLKEKFPELFQQRTRQQAPPGNGGAGSNQQKLSGSAGMNNFIRRAAGRK
jgi:hypothetical protein